MLSEAPGTRLAEPFYDPEKSYDENVLHGPFGAFASANRTSAAEETAAVAIGRVAPESLAGVPLRLPFGIAAGPLVNGRYVRAALDMGFDLPVYKTVRTREYAVHGWPNVLSIDLDEDLQPDHEPLQAHGHFRTPHSVTNSFGVPSFAPEVWQPDMADAVRYARPGQAVVGSFQGTVSEVGGAEAYVRDFGLAARLVKETGVRIAEVNLSCPNEGTAHLLCFDIERTRRVVDAIRQELGTLPLLVKLAYFREEAKLRELLVAIGPLVDGVVAINTLPARIVDSAGGQALPGEGRLWSGVGGRAIRWAGLELVERLVALRGELGQRFAIVGTGGVDSPEAYRAYRERGADAVMSATGAMWNPYLAQQIYAQEAEIAPVERGQ